MHELTYTDLINDEVKKPITEHKYNGKDDSILYEKVISPLCEYLTDNWVPEWLAPNTITVVGFLFNLVPHLYVMATEALGYEHSRWIYLVHGLCILIYIVAAL